MVDNRKWSKRNNTLRYAGAAVCLLEEILLCSCYIQRGHMMAMVINVCSVFSDLHMGNSVHKILHIHPSMCTWKFTRREAHI